MKEMKERTALGEAILKHWREHCPQMVRDLEKENRLDQAVFEDAGEDGRLAVRTGVGEEDGLSRGVGAGGAGVGAAGRGPSGGGPSPVRDIEVREVEAREIQISDIEPEPEARPPPRDFRINEAHRIGQGGLKEKARDNIAAIRTLKFIEDEGREPREDETAVLARYCRITSTEQCACRATDSATLPISRRSHPCRPCPPCQHL